MNRVGVRVGLRTSALTRVWILASAFLAAYSSVLSAATPETKNMTVDQRLTRLENQVTNQSVVELFNKVERLQQEVSNLQGELEEARHALQTLTQQQKDLYLDLDTRIQQLSSSGGALGGGESTEPANSLNLDSSSPLQEQNDYQAAFSLLKDGKYDEAIVAFEKFTKTYPQGSYADNAQYWLGEAYYVRGKYGDAVKAFAEVVNKYPNSSKVQDAELKLGFSHYELQQWKKARNVLESVMKKYPNTSASRLADKRLQQMRLDGR